jgi:riboflavin synthase
MFTGLVEGLGRVVRLTPQGPDAVALIEPPWPIDEIVIGESIAVNGACLTATKVEGKAFYADISAESLSRTTLGGLAMGSLVNLERAMKLGDRLGGHLVSGHVDCVGTITRLSDLGASVKIEVSIPPEHLRYVIEKGSVALQGISLTVNKVDPKGFSLNIIPHTMDGTTLHIAKQGDSVNIETDLIGKYVARLMPGAGDDPDAHLGPRPDISLDDLRKAGF